MESKREVIAAIIEGFPGGKPAAAAVLGMNIVRFNNHQYESKGSRPFDDDQIYQLEQIAGTTHYANYIARLYEGVYVPRTERDELDSVELESLLMNLCASNGELHITISQTTQDGVISKTEEKMINEKRDRALVALHQYIEATKAIYKR